MRYSCIPPLGPYDLGGLFKVFRFKLLYLGGRDPYGKTRCPTTWALRNDTVRLCGSLQRAWLNNAQTSASHCGWRNRSRRTRNNSVGANDPVLKISAVQAPSCLDPPEGFVLHEIANSFDDHQPSTPFTRHIVPSWILSLVPLCQTLGPDHLTRTSSWTSACTVSFMQRLRRRPVHTEGFVVG